MSVHVLVFVACVVACAAGHLAILLAVARRPVASMEPGVPRPRRALEILWAVLPAIVLALVITATWERVRDRQAEPAEMMKVAR